MSSLTLPPRWAVTACAAPSRQRQRALISLASVGAWTASAPSLRTSFSSAWIRVASSALPSASAITMNLAASGSSMGNAPRVAFTAPASRYSSAAGTTPLARADSIAAQPVCVSSYTAANGSVASGAGISLTHAAVTMPRVPSEPISSDLRSYPATSFRIGPPILTSSPGASTTSSPLIHAPVTPYLKACGPPALVAMLPPSCDCSAEPGSGG